MLACCVYLPLYFRHHQGDEQPQAEAQDAPMQDATAPPTAPAAMSTANRKRPRLDLAVDSRDRKRGKSIFGLVLGTLNKAKNEDKERNASEAVRLLDACSPLCWLMIVFQGKETPAHRAEVTG